MEDKLPNKALGDSKVEMVAEGNSVVDNMEMETEMDMFAAADIASLAEDKLIGDMEQQAGQAGTWLLDKEQEGTPEHTVAAEHRVALHPCASEQMKNSSNHTFEVFVHFGSAK